MPWSRALPSLVPTPSHRRTTDRLTASAALALLALIAPTAEAQGRAAPAIALHVPVSRFDFVASGDTQPPSKPLVVHNGGTAPLTGVRLTRLAYADSARGAAWLVSLPRQSKVAPDELATVGTLCVDPTGLRAGTYHATAAVGAHELAAPVAITITLVVTDAAARGRHRAACPLAVRQRSAR